VREKYYSDWKFTIVYEQTNRLEMRGWTSSFDLAPWSGRWEKRKNPMFKKKREPEQLCQVNQATLPDADACMWSLLARWVANLAMHGDASQHKHPCSIFYNLVFKKKICLTL